MPRLFTYTVRVDDGAAPNPFGGMCSLAICKPGIRRVAQAGDWVVGLGSVNAPSGNLARHVVYAMFVEGVMTLEEYDRRALQEWPHRVPDIGSLGLSKRLGDCIYDYSRGSPPSQRDGVHGPGNRDTDLDGRNVLISKDFYYFGNRALKLPDALWGMCHQTQGHRSNSNTPYFQPFVAWIRGLNLEAGQLYGWPDHIVDWSMPEGCGGCAERQRDDAHDPDC